MYKINRRDFVKLSGIVATGAMVGVPHIAKGGAARKVVVVGGGTGGATAARYIRMVAPSIAVTIVEPNRQYHTCYFSNEVLSGERTMESIRFGYQGLEKRGIEVIHDRALHIDAKARTIKLQGGQSLPYDRAIVSPGIDFKWEAIEGYDAKIANKIPHAWQAGEQTVTLRKQLVAMPDGGKVIIAPPPNPFRCPPGPYDRVSQIAMYLQHHKPKSKIIILDPKDKFSKFGLFTTAWKKLYGYGTDNSLIEWVSGADGGKVSQLDAGAMTVSTEFDDIKGDVINIIPPQKAGKIAFDAGLMEGDWCPVDKKTFESTLHAGIHVIGDAADAAKMPKSGYGANSQAKIAAAAVVDYLNDRELGEPSYVNTCYSIAGKDYGFSVAAVYKLSADGKTIASVEGAGGLTPADASPEMLKREVAYARSWYANMTDDIFG
uniref:Sulfide dehydrogenase (Flavocytochrome c), flavoprotein subunit n=1 Tax=Candidatus Kentrum sp. UNK TaxID=2126344 RepID=A0A451A3L5_9GAMM|nr:MAG: sulfide dehydrogenase (flavocytochrome c), flavoprotein subunit [Candidatus Kentron sp. UNK]VFK69875.1 MAG: sulfide dehydrogenase (flavocytochrome c), flavoprotein subunit [Candidatus Kentron sp. UNK]